MAKPCLNQSILQSAGRKIVNFGVFLKGEDNIPVFFLNSYMLLCYKSWLINILQMLCYKCFVN